MNCGFCPEDETKNHTWYSIGSMKFHLIHHHGVHHTTPEGRKNINLSQKTNYINLDLCIPCKTCSLVYDDPQVFYDHLDLCILKYISRGITSEMDIRHLMDIVGDIESDVERKLDLGGIKEVERWCSYQQDDPKERERRRALALRALDQRLLNAKADT
jgi:hypothetical protein